MKREQSKQKKIWRKIIFNVVCIILMIIAVSILPTKIADKMGKDIFD